MSYFVILLFWFKPIQSTSWVLTAAAARKEEERVRGGRAAARQVHAQTDRQTIHIVTDRHIHSSAPQHHHPSTLFPTSGVQPIDGQGRGSEREREREREGLVYAWGN